MSLDQMRRTAVRVLQETGYIFDGKIWKAPTFPPPRNYVTYCALNNLVDGVERLKREGQLSADALENAIASAKQAINDN